MVEQPGGDKAPLPGKAGLMVQHYQEFMIDRKVIFLVDEVNSVHKRGVKEGHHMGRSKFLLNQVQTLGLDFESRDE